MIDSVLSGVNRAAAVPGKSGHTFTYAATNAAPSPGTSNANFSVLASSVSKGSSDTSTFCSDQMNVVRKGPAGTVAGPDDTGRKTFAGAPL